MNPIEACEWAQASYLLFSDNVFDPLIYYSHLGPFVASFVLLLFIFFTNSKDFLNRILILLISTFCAWSLLDLILWASEKPDLIMFFWSALSPLEFLLYTLALYFTYYFVFRKKMSNWLHGLLLLTWVPIVIFAASHYNLNYFDLTNCEREGLEGALWDYIYVLEWFILFLIFGLLGWSIFTKKIEKSKRSENILVLLGTILFLLFFSSGNILGSITSDWSIGQYGLFGMPLFIAFLAYSIVRYETLNIKTLGVQVLVVAIVILIGAELFFIKAFFAKIITLITLTLVVFFGYLLIRSTQKEAEQKKQLEEIAQALSKSNERLKALDQAKTEFISIASHQLRTPLTAIKGYVSLLLEESYGKLDKNVEDVLNKVYSVNDRLAHLVEDLLNVSRIEAGRIQYNFKQTKLPELLKELQDTFLLNAKSRNLSLELKLPAEEFPPIIVDPDKIKEVVSNLIDNALKYTPEGGVTIALTKTTDCAQITISDTGIGITPEVREHLFEKFRRSKETSQMVVGGAGLGLFVGKNFVEAHHGRLWAESEGKGKGSSFIIQLPLHRKDTTIGTVEKGSDL